jgi:hypothetical protein
VATLTSRTSESQYENVPAFILADSAYPSTSRVVPTFKNHECNRSRDINRLNKKLAGIRYCVENAFDICKGQFRLLYKALECAKGDVVRASYIISAICVLHNFCIDERDDTPVDLLPEEAVDDDNLNGDDGNDGDEGDEDEQGGLPTREILLRYMYWRNSLRR